MYLVIYLSSNFCRILLVLFFSQLLNLFFFASLICMGIGAVERCRSFTGAQYSNSGWCDELHTILFEINKVDAVRSQRKLRQVSFYTYTSSQHFLSCLGPWLLLPLIPILLRNFDHAHSWSLLHHLSSTPLLLSLCPHTATVFGWPGLSCWPCSVGSLSDAFSCSLLHSLQ